MADITSFPSITDGIEVASDVYTFVAEAAIKRGQFVAFNATGVDFSVLVALLATDLHTIGVALEDADNGDKVSVKLLGPIVYVANESGSVAIDAGDELTVDALGAVRAAAAGEKIFGISMEDIAADSTGRMMMFASMFETA